MVIVRRLSVPPQRRGFFTRGVAFGEAAQAIVCGSDHGKVYVFGLKSSDDSESLVHGEGNVLFLTLHPMFLRPTPFRSFSPSHRCVFNVTKRHAPLLTCCPDGLYAPQAPNC